MGDHNASALRKVAWISVGFFLFLAAVLVVGMYDAADKYGWFPHRRTVYVWMPDGWLVGEFKTCALIDYYKHEDRNVVLPIPPGATLETTPTPEQITAWDEKGNPVVPKTVVPDSKTKTAGSPVRPGSATPEVGRSKEVSFLLSCTSDDIAPARRMNVEFRGSLDSVEAGRESKWWWDCQRKEDSISCKAK
jgi:hypothetical protein